MRLLGLAALLLLFAACSAGVTPTSDGGLDGSPAMCGSGTTRCGGACADLMTDRANCGTCGHGCPGAMLCTAGACAPCGGTGQPACCGTGQILCTTGCADPTTSTTDCGGCGHACSTGQTCTSGVCTCPAGAGTTSCGMAGCIDLMTDAANCGRCGNSCGTGTCAMGACTCTGSLVSCGTGCADLSTDPRNCGHCGMRCTGGGSCISGVSASAPGPTTSAGGGCADVQNDPRNCGTCGHACMDTETCAMGSCVCRAGLASCGGACVDTAADPAHCGGCTTTCTGTTPLCSAGTCIGGTCPGGTRMCGSGCADTRTDPLHCGDCTTTCAVDEACIGGNCEQVMLATGCTTCPCTACFGDTARCCQSTTSGAPALCTAGGGCPLGYTAP